MPSWTRRRFLAAGAVLAGMAGCAPWAGKASRGTVVVIGGGYGGATAAKYVRLFDSGVNVYLVDPAEPYWSCPGSNGVVAGMEELASLERRRESLRQRWGVELVKDSVTAVDGESRRVRLAGGGMLAYDRLIVAPGIDFRWDAIEGYDETVAEFLPHAWKAGPQTDLLRRQLQAMPDGGTVAISVPANPYRCPPGPYERASLIAHYCQRHKPRSKILILDAKTQFTKQALFQEGWRRHYGGMLEWLPYTTTGRLERVAAKRRSLVTEFDTFQADVINLIPPQQAGSIARLAGLTDNTGWCPVHPDTFSSTLLPNVHVIGDACTATPMPKSAFAANNQAKACALAIVSSLQGKDVPAPVLINTCYSFITPEQAVSVAGVYRVKEGHLISSAGGETALTDDWGLEAKHAMGWRKAIAEDTFG